MANKYLTVHGHFYQPPRQDPFTGKVPREVGAEPYHDFNEKINAECYRPNAEAGNFRRISFNIGPTLAAWLEKRDVLTYREIIAADRSHYSAFGCGNAIAQAYNHTILPLSSSKEKKIQIAWGIADFVHRFGHAPEGMWLGEAAVDYETLSLMADAGIVFTLLAPWQAASPIDITEPYVVRLPKGKSIVAFFFNDALSAAVSFDDSATSNADVFATRMLSAEVNRAKALQDEAQLILIATDGEVYGHHKLFRDKFLSYLLTVSAPREGFEVVSPSRYLRLHPPRREVLIEEDTSWSCHHGIKRWRGPCDCVEGSGTWKWYLRHALNKLANRIDDIYETKTSAVFHDPWKVVEEYIRVKLGESSSRTLLNKHRVKGVAADDRALMKLVEAEYYRQLMFTSCGFFFEDLDRIEPRNNIAFAAKAIKMINEVNPDSSLEDEFVRDLAAAKSWRTGLTAAELYAQITARKRGRMQFLEPVLAVGG